MSQKLSANCLFAAGFALLYACAEDIGSAENANTSRGEDGTGTGDEGSPVYVLTTTVFDDTSSATYVALVDSLDDQDITLSSAAEFAGWSSVAAHEGALFVGHGEKPEITRYELREDGTLDDDDALTMSFASYGLTTASLSFN